jgi:adenosine deaminase
VRAREGEGSGPIGHGTSDVPTQPFSPDLVRLPKADLHVHQERSPRLERILARERGTIPTDWSEWSQRLMKETAPGMPRLQRLWALRPAPLSADSEANNTIIRFEELMREGAKDRAILMDIRVGHETLLQPCLIACFEEAERRTRLKYPDFHAELTVTMKLWRPQWEVEQALRVCTASDVDRVSGLDLLNLPYSAQSDWNYARHICRRAEDAGLGITAHVGEFSKHNTLEVLSLPGISRLGHAVQAAFDDRMLEAVANSGVAIEACVSSNVILGAVQRYDEHPILLFRRRGIPVALGTDDPLTLSTSIAKEYAIAAALGLSFGDLKSITRTAVEFAFTSANRRRHLLQLIDDYDV